MQTQGYIPACMGGTGADDSTIYCSCVRDSSVMGTIYSVLLLANMNAYNVHIMK